MLLVLMALVDLGRKRVIKATRWLWLALSGGLVAGPTGCDVSSGGADNAATETAGPTPDASDVFSGVDSPVDVPDEGAVEVMINDSLPPLDVPDALPDILKDCEPMVAYGPPPCESDADCEKWFGPGWVCDKAATVNYGCSEKPYPSCVPGPVDVYEAADVKPDCEPIVEYGPPPCQSDEDCRDKYGANWYCDKENQADLGCGMVTYPMCREQSLDVVTPDTPVDAPPDCPIVVYYGPPPPYGVPVCSTDQDCVDKGFPPGTKCQVDPCNPYLNQCVPPK